MYRMVSSLGWPTRFRFSWYTLLSILVPILLQSKKRGLSLEEKRNRMLDLFHEKVSL